MRRHLNRLKEDLSDRNARFYHTAELIKKILSRDSSLHFEMTARNIFK